MIKGEKKGTEKGDYRKNMKRVAEPPADGRLILFFCLFVPFSRTLGC